MINYTHIETCPECGEDIEILVESHEFADVPTECEACGYKLNPADELQFFGQATEAFVSHWADYATDEDR
jgi:predicted RNA-binding Zn-ribbon protein involved in translation (DUF1610 family)